MLGALMGDVIGSRFESCNDDIPKDFRLIDRTCHFTDDTVMTIAVAEALRIAGKDADPETISHHVTQCMQKWGRKYPHAGYGRSFKKWMYAEDPQPYHSWGNGSAMRVSPVGWLYDSLERTREVARATAIVTHDHPEGIKGAECTAALIYMARNGATKDEMAEYAYWEFGYDFHESLEELKEDHHRRRVSCMDSLPKAIRSFLDGNSFEEVVRNAVCLGGDTDTVAAIAGSIAEAMYGVTTELHAEAKRSLPAEFITVIEEFEKARHDTRVIHDHFLEGNELIEKTIMDYRNNENVINANRVMAAFRKRARAGGHLIFPVEYIGDQYGILTVPDSQGRDTLAAFTSQEESDKGPEAGRLSAAMEDVFRHVADIDFPTGFTINPFNTDKSIFLGTDALKQLVTPKYLEDGRIFKEILLQYREDERLCWQMYDTLVRSSFYVPFRTENNDTDQPAFVSDIFNGPDGEKYFPLFTTLDEMNEYDESYSKVKMNFADAIAQADRDGRYTHVAVNPYSDKEGIDLNLCRKLITGELRETLLNLTTAQ